MARRRENRLEAIRWRIMRRLSTEHLKIARTIGLPNFARRYRRAWLAAKTAVMPHHTGSRRTPRRA